MLSYSRVTCCRPSPAQVAFVLEAGNTEASSQAKTLATRLAGRIVQSIIAVWTLRAKRKIERRAVVAGHAEGIRITNFEG